MTRTPIAPTTRFLTLMALFLAVGVLLLRANDLFTGSPDPVQAGTAKERSLIRLLEPVVGADKVRVAIQGSSEQTYLVLYDAPRQTTPESAQIATDIQDIIIATGGFSEGVDRLTIRPVAFANTKASALTGLQLAELMALGLLCTALIASLLSPRSVAASRPVAQADTPPARAPAPPQRAEIMPLAEPATPVREAGNIAANDPDGTARLIRKWMNSSQGGSA